jgi:hypothetical protein
VVQRIEVQPGEEVQVDFGSGPTLIGSDGKKRRTWIFRLVLSYSRKGYSEAVLRQDTESFLRCLENAFRAFGGSTLTINLDNLKAAVLKADWADPELNPKLADFARHYGATIMPCLPRTPEHKGKIESGVIHGVRLQTRGSSLDFDLSICLDTAFRGDAPGGGPSQGRAHHRRRIAPFGLAGSGSCLAFASTIPARCK